MKGINFLLSSISAWARGAFSLLLRALGKIKGKAAAFLFGAGSGAVACLLLSGFICDKEIPGDVTVTQLEGEKVTHRDWDFYGESITFITEAEGTGRAKTKIEKTAIPEAAAWLKRTNSLEMSYGWLLGEKKSYFGLMYMRRFGRFSLGCGADFAANGFVGIKAGAAWCW